MVKRTFIFILFALFLTQFVNAQSYITTAGIRIGGGVGMSVEQKILEKTTIEGVITQQTLRNIEGQHKVSAVIKRHHYTHGRALNGYWGLGGNQTWQTSKDKDYGVNGVIGIEGTLFNLNTAIDYRPSVMISDVNGNNYFNKENLSGQFSLSLRYVIIHAPYSKKKKSKSKEFSFPPYKPTWT